MRNIRLVIEYDGTNYCGWQRQENGRTIQGEVEKVLGSVLQEHIELLGAGRTDAGVHARGQVANFRTGSSLLPGDLYRALNGLLPEDIAVHRIEEVPPEFHARYSARERVYSYTISRRPTALTRLYAWHVKCDVNVDAMRWAASSICGVHDFQAFCKAGANVNHHRCDVRTARWDSHDGILTFTIRADRFLHGMVRALVGTMVDVGRGYTDPGGFVRILECKDRSEAGQAAPAKGLVLEEVVY
jgi:tRNA pseudouridine38-40 synthase